MRTVAALLISVLLACVLPGCASPPPMPAAADLFHDELFEASTVPIRSDDAMALSPAMRTFLATRLAGSSRFIDRKQRLVDALYRKDALMLEYDAALTRTAAEAFDARAGNCLALVMMTAAFAKELGLEVRYQSVVGDAAWERAGDLYLAIGHVTLTLGDRPSQVGIGYLQSAALTIDFVPSSQRRVLHTRTIEEPRLIAMFLNNRAVEALSRGQPSDAYWWAREAIRTDPELLSAYITLGVVYRNVQRPELAEQALTRVSQRDPGNTIAMSNRMLVLRDLGRHAEASTLAQQLARLDPNPPFSFFHQGMEALRERRFEAARSLLSKEVDRAPYHHEFQFWLAVAYLELNDTRRAITHLNLALEASTTRRDRDLYAAKLDRLKSGGVRQ